MTIRATTLLALLLSPVVQADPECFRTEQDIRAEDGTLSTRTLESCRDESGQWQTTEVGTLEDEVSALEAELERQAGENEQVDAELREVERALESIKRQQRYWTLSEGIASRLAERKKWKAGRIGDAEEYGVAVPGSRLPLPTYVFIRLVEADDTIQYSVFHPELSYVRLSLSGLPVPSTLNSQLLESAAAELDRSSARARAHLARWSLLPDAQSETLSVNTTAPIAMVDASQVMDDVAWLASHIGSETIAALKGQTGHD